MTQPTTEQISEDIEKVESLITTAQRLLGEGRMVDLGAMEDRVRELTEMFRDADAEVAKPLRPNIEKLIDSLATLESELEVRRRELKNGLEQMKREKAGSAYKKEE